MLVARGCNVERAVERRKRFDLLSDEPSPDAPDTRPARDGRARHQPSDVPNGRSVSLAAKVIVACDCGRQGRELAASIDADLAGVAASACALPLEPARCRLALETSTLFGGRQAAIPDASRASLMSYASRTFIPTLPCGGHHDVQHPGPHLRAGRVGGRRPRCGRHASARAARALRGGPNATRACTVGTRARRRPRDG
jgi:hypothetical protein